MVASRLIKREKGSLPVDVRRSKTSLLKLPIDRRRKRVVVGKKKILIFLSLPLASLRSSMFMKRTKREIKQLLFTGYLNTTVKNVLMLCLLIYHSFFTLFILPVWLYISYVKGISCSKVFKLVSIIVPCEQWFLQAGRYARPAWRNIC